MYDFKPAIPPVDVLSPSERLRQSLGRGTFYSKEFIAIRPNWIVERDILLRTNLEHMRSQSGKSVTFGV